MPVSRAPLHAARVRVDETESTERKCFVTFVEITSKIESDVASFGAPTTFAHAFPVPSLRTPIAGSGSGSGTTRASALRSADRSAVAARREDHVGLGRKNFFQPHDDFVERARELHARRRQELLRLHGDAPPAAFRVGVDEDGETGAVSLTETARDHRAHVFRKRSKAFLVSVVGRNAHRLVDDDANVCAAVGHARPARKGGARTVDRDG